MVVYSSVAVKCQNIPEDAKDLQFYASATRPDGKRVRVLVWKTLRLLDQDLKPYIALQVGDLNGWFYSWAVPLSDLKNVVCYFSKEVCNDF